MISVPIDRIVPLTDARDNFSRLISDIETLSDGLYVLTKGGKPAIALINIKYLEEIMGNKEGLGARNSELDGKLVPSPQFPVPTKAQPPVPNHKTNEPVPSKPQPSPQIQTVSPKPPEAKLPNFEPPKVSAPSVQLSGVKPVSPPIGDNYDVKPSVNPTWVGETPKPELGNQVLGTSNSELEKQVLGTRNSELVEKPVPSSQYPVPSYQTPNLPPPTKPTINPWPIIPPRPSVSRDTSEATVPPRPADAGQPLASSSPAPSQNPVPAPAPKPDASSQLPVASLPAASFPRMVAPPPPPPPSSLPRIPSNFEAVPVPINGSRGPLAPSSLAPSQNQNSPLSVPKPVASSQMPEASLPPPPKIDAPAPFANSQPSAISSQPSAGLGSPAESPSLAESRELKADSPLPVTSGGIHFDQPPTTIADPGEEIISRPTLGSSSPTAQPVAVANQPAVAPSEKPPQSPASIQDLEI